MFSMYLYYLFFILTIFFEINSILLFQIGISFSYLLWAVSYNFLIFVLARFIGGISKGNVSLSMAIISDVSSNKNRGKGMVIKFIILI